MSILIYTTLSASVLLNAVLAFFLLRRKPPEKQLTKDANELLAELMKGSAVIVTQVTDPDYLFTFSPRDR